MSEALPLDVRARRLLRPTLRRTVKALCSNGAFDCPTLNREDHEETRRGPRAAPCHRRLRRFHNEDAGQPEVEAASTHNEVASIVQCITDEAKKHNATYKQTPIPQGTMLEFGDSNVVKVRYDNGETTYRFYPGERHVSNMWIEGAGKKCAP